MRDPISHGLDWAMEELTRLRPRITEVVIKQMQDGQMQDGQMQDDHITVAESRFAAKAPRTLVTAAVKKSTCKVTNNGTKEAAKGVSQMHCFPSYSKSDV